MIKIINGIRSTRNPESEEGRDPEKGAHLSREETAKTYFSIYVTCSGFRASFDSHDLRRNFLERNIQCWINYFFKSRTTFLSLKCPQYLN